MLMTVVIVLVVDHGSDTSFHPVTSDVHANEFGRGPAVDLELVKSSR
jgi:hypothetical protein